MITVAQLKKMLNQHDDNDIVVLSSDAEGNNYNLFVDTSPVDYYRWDLQNHEIISAEDELTEDDLKKYPPCVILWPY